MYEFAICVANLDYIIRVDRTDCKRCSNRQGYDHIHKCEHRVKLPYGYDSWSLIKRHEWMEILKNSRRCKDVVDK